MAGIMCTFWCIDPEFRKMIGIYDPEWQTFDMSYTWKTNLKVHMLETYSCD